MHYFVCVISNDHRKKFWLTHMTSWEAGHGRHSRKHEVCQDTDGSGLAQPGIHYMVQLSCFLWGKRNHHHPPEGTWYQTLTYWCPNSWPSTWVTHSGHQPTFSAPYTQTPRAVRSRRHCYPAHSTLLNLSVRPTSCAAFNDLLKPAFLATELLGLWHLYLGLYIMYNAYLPKTTILYKQASRLLLFLFPGQPLHSLKVFSKYFRWTVQRNDLE